MDPQFIINAFTWNLTDDYRLIPDIIRAHSQDMPHYMLQTKLHEINTLWWSRRETKLCISSHSIQI